MNLVPLFHFVANVRTSQTYQILKPRSLRHQILYDSHLIHAIAKFDGGLENCASDGSFRIPRRRKSRAHNQSVTWLHFILNSSMNACKCHLYERPPQTATLPESRLSSWHFVARVGLVRDQHQLQLTMACLCSVQTSVLAHTLTNRGELRIGIIVNDLAEVRPHKYNPEKIYTEFIDS